MLLKIILLFLLAVIPYSFAEYFSKIFGQSPSIKIGIITLFCYFLSSSTWLAIIYIKKDLFVTSLAWYGMGTLVSFIIGVLMFSEVLKPLHFVGILFTIIGTILLML